VQQGRLGDVWRLLSLKSVQKESKITSPSDTNEALQRDIKIFLDFYLSPRVYVPRTLYPIWSDRVWQELDKDILKCKGCRYALKESGGFFLSVIVFIRL
jgi:hypothetical protein